MWRIWLLVCCISNLQAQSRQLADPNTLARIEGRVVNSVTGEPLRKSELNLIGTGAEYSATADTAGHFTIDKITPGIYSLIIQHQNFELQHYGATHPAMPGTKITLAPGQSLTTADIKMLPFGVISGKILDEDGEPFSGAQIVVLRWGYMDGHRRLQPMGGMSSSDDRGQFRIYNLRPGRYFLQARPVRYEYRFAEAPGRRALHYNYVTTFYPSSLDTTSAAQITVAAGQEAPGMDVQLKRARVYQVSGKVAGVDLSSPQFHRLSLTLREKESTAAGASAISRGASLHGPDGLFTFEGVLPGVYTLMVMLENRPAGRQEVIVANSDIEGIVIATSAPGIVKGRVTLISSVAKPPSLKHFSITLSPVDELPMYMPNSAPAEDGTFQLDQTPAGRYRVNLSIAEGCYLKAMTWNGQPIEDDLVDVPSGGSGTLDLTFASTTAHIDGEVKTPDDQPAPGASVLLVPTSRRNSDLRVVTADPNGHFDAKGVAPGSYTALSIQGALYGMPDVALLKALEKDTVSVTVDENGHATASLKMIPESAIDAAQ